MAVEALANDFTTTLGAAITTTSATSITTASAAPTALQGGGQFRIRIDSELLLVTAGASGTTWTVTRGIEGTTAATHSNGATIEHVLSAGGIVGSLGWAPSLSRTPEKFGWRAMAFDPYMANSDQQTPSKGTGIELACSGSFDATTVEFQVRTTVAAGVTSATIAFFYANPGDTNATKISSDTDVSAVITSAGWKAVTITGGLTVTHVAGGRLFASVVTDATTKPAFRSTTAVSTEFRSNAIGTGTFSPTIDLGNLTAQPASMSLAGVSVPPSAAPWFGVR